MIVSLTFHITTIIVIVIIQIFSPIYLKSVYFIQILVLIGLGIGFFLHYIH